MPFEKDLSFSVSLATCWYFKKNCFLVYYRRIAPAGYFSRFCRPSLSTIHPPNLYTQIDFLALQERRLPVLHKDWIEDTDRNIHTFYKLELK